VSACLDIVRRKSDCAVYSNIGTATWVADLTFAQDWNTADSLSAYLFENEGEEVTLTFEPINGVSGTWTATVIVAPGAVGGAVDSFAEATVSLPIQGHQYVPEISLIFHLLCTQLLQ